MDIRKMFPNKYLNGDDLAGRAHVVTIAKIAAEKMRAQSDDEENDEREPVYETKWVVYFVDRRAGRVLNKTVANQIATVLGSTDTDHWVGKDVEVFPVKIRAFGKIKNVAHFRKARNKPATVPVQPAQPAPTVDQATGEVLTHGQPSD